MRARAKGALENAAGPAPWWTATLPEKTHCDLEWRRDDDTSVSTLYRDGLPVLSLGFYCYTLALANHMLIWHTTGTPTEPDGLHMEIYNFDQFATPLAQRPQQSGGSIRAQIAPTATLNFDRLLEGSRECAFPQEMLELDELFFFFNAGTSTALWHLQPARGHMTAYPQDWFNAGDWDYGYQWPTRVQREAQTGLLFGEGIRIGYFALSPTMRTLQWREQ